MSILPKLISTLNSIPIRILIRLNLFSCESWQTESKIYIEIAGSKIVETVLKRNKVEELVFLN